MKTCFICGCYARLTEPVTGETLCHEHFLSRHQRRGVSVNNEWERLRQTASWMAGSAYQRDQETFKRLSELTK